MSGAAHPGPLPRHPLLVRITHWITVLAFGALLLSGIEILISHPRFYWGETGNSGTTPLFQIPIPSSRASVPTGYNYVLPDQNGWSRSLHFQAAWAAVFTGLVYLLAGIATRHFRRRLLPESLSWSAIQAVLAQHLRRQPDPDPGSYNVLQRLTYLAVVFLVFPLIIWTGLALSPAIGAVLPSSVELLGGRQSARTLHFFLSAALVLFFFVHIAMVVLSGFRARMRAMITGAGTTPQERPQ